MVFTREKMIRPIRIANNVFSCVRKMIRPIRSHRGVWVSRQNSHLLLQLAAPLRTHSTRKVLLKEFFSLKKWKTFWKWSGIVSFVSLSIKKTVESRRNNSRKGKTEWDVSFCCAFCRSYFVFHLSLSFPDCLKKNAICFTLLFWYKVFVKFLNFVMDLPESYLIFPRWLLKKVVI